MNEKWKKLYDGKKKRYPKNDNLSTHFLSKIYLLITGLIPRDQEVNMKIARIIGSKKEVDFFWVYHKLSFEPKMFWWKS